MTLAEFATLVVEMRSAQRRYFRRRGMVSNEALDGDLKLMAAATEAVDQACVEILTSFRQSATGENK